eukprot:Selendium_serpulae@DN4719_c0_g1_i1.p1
MSDQEVENFETWESEESFQPEHCKARSRAHSVSGKLPHHEHRTLQRRSLSQDSVSAGMARQLSLRRYYDSQVKQSQLLGRQNSLKGDLTGPLNENGVVATLEDLSSMLADGAAAEEEYHEDWSMEKQIQADHECEMERLQGSCGSIELLTELSDYTLTQECLEFEPTERDIADGGIRYICLNSPLTEYEQTALSALRHQIDLMIQRSQGASPRNAHVSDRRSQSKVLSPNAEERPSDNKPCPALSQLPSWATADLLRFLHSSHFDIKAAAQMVLSNVEFRRKQLPITEPSVIRDLLRGGAYWHGRDCKMRPLLIVKVGRLGKLGSDDSPGTPSEASSSLDRHRRTERVLVFCFEFFLRHLTVAGRVENWNILVDCEGKGLTNFPTDTLKAVMSALNTRYRGRMFRLYLINFPKWISWFTSFIKTLVPGSSVQKLIFAASSTEYQSKLAEVFSPTQLEERYGGVRPNVEGHDCYPFRFFPGPYDTGSALTPEDDGASKQLHTRIKPRGIAGSLWELPVPVKSYKQYLEDHCSHGKTETDGKVDCDCYFHYIQTLPRWVYYLQHDSLTTRSRQWIRSFLEIPIADESTYEIIL